MMMQLINSHTFNYLPEIFTTEQLRKLFEFVRTAAYKRTWSPYRDWARLRNYCIVVLMYELALRPNEARAVKETEIDFSGKKIMINSASNKQKRGRVMALSDEIITILKEYLKHPMTRKYMRDRYIFPTSQNKLITKHAWKEIFEGILKAAGIYKSPMRITHGHLSSYSLRHSRATYLYIETKDIFFVANFLGHTTLQSTMVYIHLAQIVSGYYDRMRKVMHRVSHAQGIHIMKSLRTGIEFPV